MELTIIAGGMIWGGWRADEQTDRHSGGGGRRGH